MRVIGCVSVLVIDKMHVMPRYPDAFIEGVPFERYTREEAVEALNCASLIINWVRGCSPCRLDDVIRRGAPRGSA